ncbi:MAG: Uma2 family endonuclease [Planctomycetes bacterium]|nr:Uma2 family endonuclease [Planctomycetota bacterium]
MSVSSPPREHVLLEGVSWATYVRLRAELDPRPIRLTYDDGRLEIVSPGQRHERDRKHLAQLFEVLTEELDVPRESCGSTTWQREDLLKGLEPDECYWIQNADVIAIKGVVDLAVDPPPDLAIEVDVTSSSLDRMRIYAALGVPEVWRWKDDELTAWVLGPDRRYAPAERSFAIPRVVVAELGAFVVAGRRGGELAWIRGFRRWVRERLA